MKHISEEDVEKALDYLRENATVAASARANRTYVEEYRKVIKAEIMAEYNALAVNAREQYAYSDDRYKQHLEAIKQAVFEDEKHRFLREAAVARVDAWRTQQATERSMKL